MTQFQNQPVCYLVTGGAGHLGQAVVRELLRRGRWVRALVRPGDPAARRLPADVELIEGDVLDRRSLQRFFALPQGCERIVIHCAGVVSTSSRFEQRVYDVNVTGTENVLRQCERSGVRRLVYVSSVHAIPELPRGEIMTEQAIFDASLVVGPYAASKAQATAQVFRAARRDLDTCVVFPSGILGPLDFGRGHLTQLVIDFCQGTLPAGVRGGYDFVDVRDVARGIVSCCDRGRRGEGYLLTGRYVSVSELLETLHAVGGGRRVRCCAPLWLARMGVPLCALYYKLKKQPPLFNSYSLHTLGSNALYSHEKAAHELSYTPRPLEQTIRDTVEWLTREGRTARPRRAPRVRRRAKNTV